jgi:hypothetical protein
MTAHLDIAQILFGIAAIIMAWRGLKDRKKHEKEKKDGIPN